MQVVADRYAYPKNEPEQILECEFLPSTGMMSRVVSQGDRQTPEVLQEFTQSLSPRRPDMSRGHH